MSDAIQHHTLETQHGRLAYSTIGTGSPAILLIHGNSTNTTIFTHILSSPLSHHNQLIALDLPGHGLSSNAPNPSSTYHMPGYASAAASLLQHLDIASVIILGWSLGGHIAIEMLPLLPDVIKGIMIVGTPPIPRGDVAAGFYTDPHISLAGQDHLNAEEIEIFSHNTAGPPYEQWMREAVVRTDGRARKIMFDALHAGKGVDQREVLENTNVLTAVVDGAEEPFININYIDTVKYGNLWEGKCHRIEGLGHAPFWEKPEKFQEILERFVDDCTKGLKQKGHDGGVGN